MEFFRKNRSGLVLFGIICFVKLLLKIFFGSYIKDNETINFIFEILDTSLFFPLFIVLGFIIDKTFNRKMIDIKSLIIIMVIWVSLNSIVGYFNHKIINYPYIIGNIIGGILVVYTIYPYLKSKENEEKN